MYTLYFLIILTLSPVLNASQRGAMIGQPGKEYGSSVKPLFIKTNTTTIINSPGSYIPANDIVFSPTEVAPMIRISSSNVHLNFNGRPVIIATNLSGINCIVIDDNLSNVTIRSGVINNVTGVGIIVGEQCRNIQIVDMVITKVSLGGINFKTGCSNVVLHNCFIGDSTITSNDLYGIKFTTTNNVKIVNCTISNLETTSQNYCYGIDVSNGSNYTIDNTQVNNNRAGGVSAIRCTNTTGVTINNSETKKNIGTTTQTCGIEFNQVSASSINFCEAFSNTCPQNAIGIYLNNGCWGNTISNTTASCQTSTTGSSYGLQLNGGSKNYIRNCKAFGNNGGTQSTSIGAGILLQNESRTTVEDSLFDYNNGTTGKGYGILLNNSLFCTIKNNRFYHNIGTAGGWGIFENIVTTSFIIQNEAFANQTKNYIIPLASGTFPYKEVNIKSANLLPTLTAVDNLSIIS